MGASQYAVAQNLQPLVLFHQKKKEHNLNYSTTTRPAHRHTYTYTHTSVHIYTCTQTNKEKSFESGLWLAGVAVKCQLMGMFV